MREKKKKKEFLIANENSLANDVKISLFFFTRFTFATLTRNVWNENLNESKWTNEWKTEKKEISWEFVSNENSFYFLFCFCTRSAEMNVMMCENAEIYCTYLLCFVCCLFIHLFLNRLQSFSFDFTFWLFKNWIETIQWLSFQF